MPGLAQAEQLWSNIRDLGTRRLIALGLIALAVMLAIGLGVYYLSQPEREALYTGLSRDDVTRMGGVLKDSGIPFDVSADGSAVLVGHRDTARARMLLAEKGLPQNTNSGYELFNDLGSFGLTSFMQQVTKVRALEGELARTIQGMKGIKAARVHIVLPERGSFRTEQQPATASVVIRTESADDTSSAQAIRYLVAAAIPDLKPEGVTVLNTDGRVLASGDMADSTSTGKMTHLEEQINSELTQNIRKTLTPYLGLNNFEVSVSSRLNTDKTRTSETIYDPDSRVERSVRVVRENNTSQNRASQPPTTVQQNIPQEQVQGAAGNDSAEESNRREELTNYEVSAKTIERVSDGYTVERLSIAVLVNRDRLLVNASTQGGSVPVDDQLKDIEQLVRSAVGFNAERGDQIKVSAVSFAEGGNSMEPVPPLGIKDLLLRQMGTLINAAAILIVAVLLIWFGLKPAVRAILAQPQAETAGSDLLIEGPDSVALAEGSFPQLPASDNPNLIEDLTSRMNRSPQKRLEQMVEYDEEQVAAILKQWMRQEETAA